MAVKVTISSITGQSPYNVFVCQPDGSSCFYITTISSTSYVFDIPSPYNTSPSYMLKVIDNDNCIISGVTTVQ